MYKTEQELAGIRKLKKELTEELWYLEILERGGVIGKELMKVHYAAAGTDEKAIEQFVTDVVLNGNDEKKEMREEFFTDNLDYMKTFGKNAAANIFEQIKMEFDH